jgi:alcohol dehydrogenase class IV
MRTVRLLQPQKIFFGTGCAAECTEELVRLGHKRVFVVTSPPVAVLVEPLADTLTRAGVSVIVYDQIDAEPAVATVEAALLAARTARADAVLGIGGGSAMDVAKVVAALYDGQQDVRDTFGIENLVSRALFLCCLPTTAGTGSEVSPNSILLDEAENLKKGIVSPHLVPDAAYVDPLLTVSMPPGVTAATGLDALIHCIEAYANRFAHPIVDLHALQGIRLINHSLVRAVQDGDDLEARTNMALASLYGGLCLAPVNTAAVHALSYPLGSEFHVAHGISNAVLLPHVFRFNMSAAPERHAQIALALGVDDEGTSLDIAQRGLARIEEIFESCGVPTSLVELGVPREAIPSMAQAAMQVTRLLNNNLRELTADDAEAIYQAAYD